MECDPAYIGKIIGQTSCFHVIFMPNLDVELIVTRESKCLQVRTASQQADDSNYSEWQQRHKCYRCFDYRI